MADTGSDWHLLSWFGVRFEIPPDWTLAAATGDRTRGSLRVEDEFTTRAEVAWQPIHRKRTLEQAVEEVRKRFRRNIRKRKEEAEIEDFTGLKLRRKGYHLFLCTIERDDRPVETINMVYRCEDCRRAIIASVYYRPRERRQMHQTARRLFDSVRDHASGDNDVWSAYGVRLEVPSDYDLAGSSLRVGLVDLQFVRKDWQIDLLRAAMADVQIRRSGLAAWFAKTYAKRLRHYTTTTTRTEFRGHAALAVSGRTKMARTLMKPLRPRDRIYVRAWHCQNTDKLFIFRLSAPKEAEDLFDDLLKTVVCH